MLALMTGLRRGELLGLRWSDVNIVERRLVVRRSLQINDKGGWVLGAPKTKRSRRPVLLTLTSVEALIRHRERQDTERDLVGEAWHDLDLVFSNTGGNPLGEKELLNRFYPLLERAGLPKVRFHDYADLEIMPSIRRESSLTCGFVWDRVEGIGIIRDANRHLPFGGGGKKREEARGKRSKRSKCASWDEYYCTSTPELVFATASDYADLIVPLTPVTSMFRCSVGITKRSA